MFAKRCRYPKPGTPNPLISIHTFHLPTYRSTQSVSLAKQELSWPASIPEQDRIIMEVGWVGDDALLIKEIDRAARKGSVVVFTNNEAEGKVVRTLGRDGEEGDDGWIDHVSGVVRVVDSAFNATDVAGLMCLGPKCHPG